MNFSILSFHVILFLLSIELSQGLGSTLNTHDHNEHIHNDHHNYQLDETKKPLNFAGNGIVVFVNNTDRGTNCTTYDECWELLYKYYQLYTTLSIYVFPWRGDCFSLFAPINRQFDYEFTISSNDTFL